jgi:uncharacterized protein
MLVQDEVIFRGHHNVMSNHKKSIEITRENDLSLNGNCIIGVRSNKGCSHLDPLLRCQLRKNNTLIKMELIVDDMSFVILGRGDFKLMASDTKDIVIRKSNFCCPRTLSISCDKAASDIPIGIIRKLKNPESSGLLRITAE